MNDIESLLLFFVLAYPVVFGVGEIISFIVSCIENNKHEGDADDNSRTL